MKKTSKWQMDQANNGQSITSALAITC